MLKAQTDLAIVNRVSNAENSILHPLVLLKKKTGATPLNIRQETADAIALNDKTFQSKSELYGIYHKDANRSINRGHDRRNSPITPNSNNYGSDLTASTLPANVENERYSLWR